MFRTAVPVALLAACFSAAPEALHAQSNELTIEASVFRGTVGYARTAGGRTLIGVEAGFGFPQIDRTLEPATDDATGEPDFEEYLHAALFARQRVSGSFEVDAGVRLAVADLWSCTASDCWPALFAGGYVQPMAGGKRLKVGMRLTAGWIGERMEPAGDGTTFTAALAPLLVRYTLPW